MTATRRTVLEQLAAQSDAGRGETTTIDALAAALDTDTGTVESRLHGLATCELARVAPDGTARITVTGEQLLELEADELIVVDPTTEGSEV